jgi:hypothetical protein
MLFIVIEASELNHILLGGLLFSEFNRLSAGNIFSLFDNGMGS